MKKLLFGIIIIVLIVGWIVWRNQAATVQIETEAAATAVPTQNKEAGMVARDGPWEIVFQTEIEQPTRIAAFHDETFGVTGGEADVGKAHRTTDGGTTWTMADSSAG